MAEGFRFLRQLLTLRLDSPAMRFMLVGASGVIPNLGVLWLLMAAGMHVVPATVLAIQVAIVWNFVGAELVVWRDNQAGKFWHRFVKYCAIAEVDLARVPLVVLFYRLLGGHVLIASLLSLVAIFLVRYLLTERLVYRRKSVRSDPARIAPPDPGGNPSMSNARSLRRSLLAVGAALVAVIALLVVASPSGAAAPNLVSNPSLETLSGSFPSCFATYGYGTSTFKTTVLTTGAHTGTRAVQEVMSGYASGDWKLMQTQSAACAPKVTAGHTYTAGVYYKSTTAALTLTAFRFYGTTWSYWTDLKTLPTASAYTLASVKTPAIPAGTTQISFGISIHGNGTLTLDDYSLVDNAGDHQPAPRRRPARPRARRRAAAPAPRPSAPRASGA